jgi:hypothetical protein
MEIKIISLDTLIEIVDFLGDDERNAFVVSPRGWKQVKNYTKNDIRSGLDRKILYVLAKGLMYAYISSQGTIYTSNTAAPKTTKKYDWKLVVDMLESGLYYDEIWNIIEL